jgi:hypothetical protein
VTSVLAVDIGGTKLAAGVVAREGVIMREATAPTPEGADAEGVFAALLEVIGRALEGNDDDLVACGVGCGGPMADGLVSPLNIPAWRSFPLGARLAEAVGLRTYVDNDAKALALGEGWRGEAAGCASFLAMVVSTGVGGGLVVDRRLLDGLDGNAGHIGHVIVEPDGAECVCGARGCLEARPRRPPPTSSTAPAAWSVAPSARCATCSISTWRWWPAPSPSASAPRSSPPPRPSSTGSVASSSRAALASCRPASAAGARSSAQRPWRGSAWGPHGSCERARERTIVIAPPPSPRGEAVRGWGRAGWAVARRPGLWPVAVRQALVLARPGWWRRPPFLPVPDPAYLRFRLLTAYGDERRPPTPDDLVTYLRWSKDLTT